MPEAVAGWREDGNERPTEPCLHQPAQSIQDGSERMAQGDHFQQAVLVCEQRFRPLTIFDVGGRSVPSDHFLVLVPDRDRTEEEPAILAVEPQQSGFSFARLSRGQRRAPGLDQRW